MVELNGTLGLIVIVAIASHAFRGVLDVSSRGMLSKKKIFTLIVIFRLPGFTRTLPNRSHLVSSKRENVFRVVPTVWGPREIIASEKLYNRRVKKQKPKQTG